MLKITKRLFSITVFLSLSLVAFANTLVITPTDKINEKNLTITDENIDILPSELEMRTLYNIDVCLENKNEKICKFRLLNESGKSIFDKYITKENGHYKKTVYASKNGTRLQIIFNNADLSEDIIGDFNLVPPSFPVEPVVSFNKEKKWYDVKINVTNFEDVPKSLQSGHFYNFDIDFPTANEDSEFQTIYYKENELLFGNHYFIHDEPALIYISDSSDMIDLFVSDITNLDIPSEWYIKIEKNKHPDKLKTPKSYKAAELVKTEHPDERIISYLEETNASEMAKTNPDEVLEKCVEKIKSISSSDFEKVKLIYDTAWYLLKYDMDGFENRTLVPQNYKVALKTGLTVCEGFTKVSSKMLSLAGIVHTELIGHADYEAWKNGTFQKIPNEERLTHICNLVCINKEWYYYDITFGSRKISRGESTNIYASDFLFYKPELFISNHLPFVPELALMHVTDKKVEKSVEISAEVKNRMYSSAD